MIFVFDRVENIVGKGENAGYQHFLLFLQCFPKAFYWYSGSLKVSSVWSVKSFMIISQKNYLDFIIYFSIWECGYLYIE